MYVRWRRLGGRRRVERCYWNIPIVAHALVVESVSVNGKSRQRHIAYLGGFHHHSAQDVSYRAWWWHRMSAKLDALGKRIPPDQRPRIEAMLAEKVRPVTAEEVTAFDLAHQAQIRAQVGECRACYLQWPEGTAGVPPRPHAEDHKLARRRGGLRDLSATLTEL
jgi:hypothetical protein